MPKSLLASVSKSFLVASLAVLLNELYGKVQPPMHALYDVVEYVDP